MSLDQKFLQDILQSAQTAKWKANSDSNYKTSSVTASVTLPVTYLQPSTLLALHERPCTYRGYINGFKQPVGHIKLQVISYNISQIEILQKALEYYFKNISCEIKAIQSERELVACLGEVIQALQKTVGLPIFESIQIDRPENDPIFSLWIPMLHEECFHHATAYMLQFFNHHLASAIWIPNQKLSDEFNELVDILKTHAPLGSNSLRLLQAAHQEKIPWIHIAQNTFQYGHGRHSRWFDSTFTEKTSQISVNLARDKHNTHLLLRKASLPVPNQKIVRSEQEAIKFANEMGYPVVIKPHNQDGGSGVFARLISDIQVKKAFQQAQQYSKLILLEKHIIGKDYRLLVLNGELIWAIERIPAGVTGDGISSIAELIQKENQRSERGHEIDSSLKKIKITEDVIDYLVDQGYSLSTILKSGLFVPVNRIANISTGGTPIAVFDKVHPDNKRLVESAAKLLRLDIAGIDFITPDIQQSYVTLGGSLIEVNAQPQLGIITTPHIYQQILTTMLPNKGRIPIIVIVSHSADNVIVNELFPLLSKDYKNIGIIKDSLAYLNNEMLYKAPSSFNAAEALLLNNELDLFIYCIKSCDDITHQGLPFLYYDYLFLDDSTFKAETATQQDNNMLNRLFKACQCHLHIIDNTLDELIKFHPNLLKPHLY